MKLDDVNLLVVGAGGIGCELLKNLVFSGFKTMEIIDLDTIDISNLNRQFLFKEEHVGMPKSVVAAEEIAKVRSGTRIKSVLANIKDRTRFPVEYFESFDVVISAVDNIEARRHVNYMCILADVPLIDAGTGGYGGNVFVISRGVYECFDCNIKQPRGEFAFCTIHTTPTLPVHCIMWAVQLYDRLCSEVFPDLNEAEGEAIQKEGTKVFLEEFNEKIGEIIELQSSSESKQLPTRLIYEKLDSIPERSVDSTTSDFLLPDSRVWDVSESFHKFLNTFAEISGNSADHKKFDKDNNAALDFVTAASNLRASCFSINLSSRFEVKEIAGNIIPAIATTNAIIAGVVVLELRKIVTGNIDKCRSIYLNRPRPKSKSSRSQSRRMLTFSRLHPPSSTCLICSRNSLVSKSVSATVSSFKEKRLHELISFAKLQFHFENPSIVFEDTLLFDGSDDLDSMEKEDFAAAAEKTLADYKISSGSKITVNDEGPKTETEFGVDSIEVTLLQRGADDSEKDVDISFKLVNTTTSKDGRKRKREIEDNSIEAGESTKRAKQEEEVDEIIVLYDKRT